MQTKKPFHDRGKAFLFDNQCCMIKTMLWPFHFTRMDNNGLLYFSIEVPYYGYGRKGRFVQVPERFMGQK
jgi:hypothetical protein